MARSVNLLPRSARSRIEAAEKNWNKKENTMLRKFAAALVATALLAGPALAQNSGNATPATPQAQSQPAAASVKTTKTATPVKHAKTHTAKIKRGTMHQARHAKPAKSHQARVGKTAAKSANKSAIPAVKHS
jgi:hypothetical protein